MPTKKSLNKHISPNGQLNGINDKPNMKSKKQKKRLAKVNDRKKISSSIL